MTPGIVPIDALTALDPSLLYVFVAGPSTGEGIAIAMPGQGWVVVDGCAVLADSLVERILRHWRRGEADGLLGFIWTHSHDDHAVGVARALDAFPPAWIGMAGEHADAVRALRLLTHRGRPAAAAGRASRDRQGAVAVAAKIEDLLNGGTPFVALLDGRSIALPASVTLTVRAPDPTTLERVLSFHEAHAPSRAAANEASVVFELAWGAHRLVFGGDLPYSPTGSDTPLDGGWRDVMMRAPHLATHALLKVPHHGSIHALEPPLIAPAEGVRDWVVTPFAGEHLPRAALDNGLHRLLTAQNSVRLTALPVRREAQQTLPARITRAEMEARVNAAAPRTPLPGIASPPRPRVTPAALRWDDPIWCVAFSDSAVVGRWRGRAACEIIP